MITILIIIAVYLFIGIIVGYVCAYFGQLSDTSDGFGEFWGIVAFWPVLVICLLAEALNRRAANRKRK